MSRLISTVLFLRLLGDFAERSVAYAEPVCNMNPYGAPEIEDCAYLLENFADSHDANLRIFDEEQLRADQDGSWPGIVNPFREVVVQVPRFWSRSRGNIVGG